MEENSQLRERLEQLQDLIAPRAGEGATALPSASGGASGVALPTAAVALATTTTAEQPPDTSVAASTPGEPPVLVMPVSAVAADTPSWLSSTSAASGSSSALDASASTPTPALATLSGMDPRLHAALYGPLPGTSSGGSGESSPSYPRIHTAASMTSSIEQEATNLKSENDLMEQRLKQLSASINGMTAAGHLQTQKRHGSRDATGLRESWSGGVGKGRRGDSRGR
jgi:hypothetical protein